MQENELKKLEKNDELLAKRLNEIQVKQNEELQKREKEYRLKR